MASSDKAVLIWLTAISALIIYLFADLLFSAHRRKEYSLLFVCKRFWFYGGQFF